MIDIEEGRSLLDLGGFYADLEDLLGRTVDVGTIIEPRQRDRIEPELVPL